VFSLMLGCTPANEHAPVQDDETVHHVRPAARRLVSPPLYHPEDGERLLSAGQSAIRASNRVASLSMITNMAAQRTVSAPLHDWQPSTTTAQALVELMLRQTDPAKAIGMCMIYLIENLGAIDDSVIDALRTLLENKLNIKQQGDVHSLIALCYNKQERYTEALTYLDGVLEASTEDMKTTFKRPFSHAKLGSYFGLRMQLKKKADDYAVNEYYAEMERYEAGIRENTAVLGLPWPEYDANTIAHERFERYLRMKPESRLQYMEGLNRSINDKRFRSSQHRAFVLLKEMISAHGTGVLSQ